MSSTGSSTSERIRITLTIAVETVQFDPQVGLLRINGRVVVENPHVKVRSDSVSRFFIQLSKPNRTLYLLQSFHIQGIIIYSASL